MERQTPCDDCRHNAGRPAQTLLEIAALLLLAGYLAYASLTGRVQVFLAASYAWLPPSAAALLALMALARLGQFRAGAPGDHHAHSPGALRWLLTAALLAPVVAGLAIDPRQFSVEGVKRRFTAVSSDPRLERAMAWVLGRTGKPTAARAGDATRSAETTVVELALAAESGQAESLTGRFVTLIGQCDVAGEPGQRRFGLYRFVVTCCIADARLFAVDVIAPPGLPLEPRQWVRVAGVIRLDPGDGDGQPVIQAATISKIPPPASPYL